jgi:uncharacterized protein (DUF2236 family)
VLAVSLGPDSLTWRYFGDVRTTLLGTWVVTLQNMLPDLGDAVIDHSIFTQEPLQRVARTMYPVIGVVYDGPSAASTARQIVGYHRDITGFREGRRYHALNNDTFYWGHATFFMQMMVTAEVFCGGLTEEQKRQLYDEQCDWYALYGKSMTPVPPTWEAFRTYWRTHSEQILVRHQAALDVLYMHPPKPDFLPVPRVVWNALMAFSLGGLRWVATGCFDPAIRRRLGLRWGPSDERLFRLFARQMRLLSRLPDLFRLHPRALAAYARVEGKVGPPPGPPAIFAPPQPGPQHHPIGRNRPSIRVLAAAELASVGLLGWAGTMNATAHLLNLRRNKGDGCDLSGTADWDADSWGPTS